MLLLGSVPKSFGPRCPENGSPYTREHIRRFGQYSTHQLDIHPEAYDPHLDVDFSPLRGDGQPEADGYDQAA